MKDEEMAEEYADNISGLELTCSLLSAKDKSHAYRLGRYDGFLAGLKAGRPQWHDLRENPNDLPVLETELLCQKYSGRCFVGCYKHTDRKFFSHETRKFYDIVRWADIGQFWTELLEGNETTFHCEIPTFDKENK